VIGVWETTVGKREAKGLGNCPIYDVVGFEKRAWVSHQTLLAVSLSRKTCRLAMPFFSAASMAIRVYNSGSFRSSMVSDKRREENG
jgi:hypothetical protein